MVEVLTLTTEKGIYFASTSKSTYSRTRSNIGGGVTKVNGKPLTRCLNKPDWYFIEGDQEITSMTKLVYGKPCNPHWVLRDESVAIDGVIPVQISCEDADEQYSEYEHYFGSKSPYYKYAGLYVRKEDREPNTDEPVEFKAHNNGYLDQTYVDNSCIGKTYTVYKDDYWTHQGTKELNLYDITEYSELEELIVPELAIHNRPCRLSEENSFRIIRGWLEKNLDKSQYRFASNYKTSIAIDKSVGMEPYVEDEPILKKNGRPYAKPRFNRIKHTQTWHRVFELRVEKREKEKKRYKKVLVEPFKGESLQDLKDNIDTYLDQLTKFLKTPLEKCPCCAGSGITKVEIKEEVINENT